MPQRPHREEDIIRLAQDDEMKVELLELQELLLRLVLTATKGTENSWPLPRALIMSPVQEPHPPRSLGLPTSMVIFVS